MRIDRNRLGLLALGTFAVLVYDYAFVQPYNLVYLLEFSRPPDLGVITGYAKHAAAFYVGAVSLLVAVYLASIHLASRIESQVSWRWVLALGIGMALMLVRTYPYAASDLFLYVARGRVLGVYGYSSMELAPTQMQVSAYVPFWSEWLNTASPYGPLWEWIAAFLARLGHGSALRSLLVFKMFNVACYAASGWFIYDALRLHGRGYALGGLIAFAWNPLVLLEGMANGHNDLLMVMFLALAVWCWERHRHTEFLLALACGALTKYVPVLLFPFALLALYRRVGWRRWLRYCVTAGSVSLLLLAATMGPLWPGWHLWSLGGQMQQGHNSVLVWLVLTLQRYMDSSRAFHVASWTLRAVLVAGYVGLYVKAWRRRIAFVDAAYHVLLLYLVVGSASFGYWYIAWLCALVPFVSGYRQRLWTLALSWTGLLSVPLYTFVGEWIVRTRPDLNVHLLAVPFVLLFPFVLSPWMGGIIPPALEQLPAKETGRLPVPLRTL